LKSENGIFMNAAMRRRLANLQSFIASPGTLAVQMSNLPQDKFFSSRPIYRIGN